MIDQAPGRTVIVAVVGILAVAACIIVAAFWIAHGDMRSPSQAPTAPSGAERQPAPPAAQPKAPRTAAEMRAERQRLDQTVWGKEVLAQEYEQTFVALWDAMRAHGERQHEDLASFAFTSLAIRPFAETSAHSWGITVTAMAGAPATLDQTAWRDVVDKAVADGYRLEHCEWHHATFDLDPDGTARSTVSMKLFITHPVQHRRLVVHGVIKITWGGRIDADGVLPTTDDGRRVTGSLPVHHVADAIDATQLSLTERIGDDAFVDAWTRSPAELGADADSTIDPVLVYDVDRDGAPDIALPSINALLLNRSRPGEIAFERRPLCAVPLNANSNDPRPYITAGVIGDFTGDGLPDLVVAGPDLPPCLFHGSAGGAFAAPGIPLAGLARERFRLPECMTAGDVDGDGNLDLWIGQYRRPYEDGNLPTPYWDADDGWPSFLLLNAGGGIFRDATESAGLAGKRNRRNYSASIVDLDGDGKADLVTVNDFSGVDLFRNDGKGGFADTTAAMIDERATFGMSHVIADVDGDGILDIFVSGMGSTTARRLEYMKLGRADFPEHQRERMKMGYGNRLLLGTSDHHYRQAAYNDQVARTGWSWGCTALDVANEGMLDLFLTNGNMSRSTAKDYCTRYWTHDIYASPAMAKDQVAAFFQGEADGLAGYSWNPFEHKALLMNETRAAAKGFRDVAYPMGVGFEWDGRQAVSEDFDGDGLADLLLVETRMGTHPYLPLHPVLHLAVNHMSRVNHWLGVRLQDEPGHSPMGARITVTAGTSTQVAVIVSGDSYRCQHATDKHFGLGSRDHVDAVEVCWADGTTKRVESPGIDQVVFVRP